MYEMARDACNQDIQPKEKATKLIKHCQLLCGKVVRDLLCVLEAMGSNLSYGLWVIFFFFLDLWGSLPALQSWCAEQCSQLIA